MAYNPKKIPKVRDVYHQYYQYNVNLWKISQTEIGISSVDNFHYALELDLIL
jgi:hypothetical protein